MEVDGLVRRAFVSCHDLQVVQSFFAAYNQLAHGCASNVGHLLDACAGEDRRPFLRTFDVEALEHDGAIEAGSLSHLSVARLEVLLELDEVHRQASSWHQHQRKQSAHDHSLLWDASQRH